MRLAKLLMAALAVWSLYWAVAAWGVRSGVAAWFAQQERRGWQAEYAALSTAGYPLQIVTQIAQPALADPGTGAAWRADWLALESPAIWPGQLTLRFPETAQRLSHFDQTSVIDAKAAQAQLHLAPGLALTLEALTFAAAEWALSQQGEPVLSAASLDLRMVQAAPTAPQDTYDITAEVRALKPGTGWRRALAADAGLPETFEQLALEMTIGFDAPWDRAALEQRRPQPRQIELRLADAQWGDLRLKAAGALSVDESGLPEGEIALQAENWRGMVAMAEQGGVLPPALRRSVERVLELLSRTGGNPQHLNITLGFRGGYVTLGPLPLGPAPRLILR